jgi:hypothetical protein
LQKASFCKIKTKREKQRVGVAKNSAFPKLVVASSANEDLHVLRMSIIFHAEIPRNGTRWCIGKTTFTSETDTCWVKFVANHFQR